MEYSEAYQRTRDIDWFFHIGDRCVHVASNGGKLPDFVNDILRLRQEQSKVASLELSSDSEVYVNQQYVEERLRSELQYSIDGENSQGVSNIDIEAYLTSFREMAHKGFYSYDRSLEDESKYVLICGPENNNHFIKGLQLLEANDEIKFLDEEKLAFSVNTKYAE